MKILGIDTSGPQASVALVEGGEVRAEVCLPAGSRASREALPAVERVIEAAGIGIDAVDGFAAVSGPGSFTGLRVGLATVRGLALATGRPAAGFCALELLARRVPTVPGGVCALIDAGRGEVYVGVYEDPDGGRRCTGGYRLLSAAAAAGIAARCTCIGPGFELVRPYFEAGARPGVVPHPAALAADAARRMEQILAAGDKIAPESLRPLYIRPSQAESRESWRPTPSRSGA